MFFKSSRRKKEEKYQKEQLKGATVISHTDPKSVNAEQFRTLRTNIEFAQIDSELKTILVSSSIPTEGKSTISSNLAYVLAQTGKKVLLVDADLRKPMVHRTFALSNEKGLTSILLDPEVRYTEVIHRSQEMGMFFLPSGPIPPNPAELLGSARMKKLMEELKQYFDVIIYDAPPITAVTDPQILATRVDGVVLVVRQGFVTKDEVKRAKQALDNVNANILGFVVNSRTVEDAGGYYAYYGYGAENHD